VGCREGCRGGCRVGCREGCRGGCSKQPSWALAYGALQM